MGTDQPGDLNMDASVLVVEDDQPFARAMLRMLRSTGFDAAHVASAEEARTLIATERFDLAICDLGLPGDGGLVLARELQLTRPELSLVVATGFLSPEVQASAAGYGVHDFLIKPFSERDLVMTIIGALRRDPNRGVD